MDGAIDIRPFQLVWMLGADDAAPVDDATLAAVRTIRVGVPDAGVCTFDVRLDASAPLPPAQIGSRALFTGVFGIVSTVLGDGVVTGDTVVGDERRLTGEDLSWWLDRVRRDRHIRGTPTSVAERVLRDAELPGAIVEVLAPRGEVGEGSWHQTGTDRAFLDELGRACGCVLTVRPGTLPMSSVVRFAPVAMLRTDVPPIHPEHLETSRFFTPAPGVRVAEVSLRASATRRLVSRGVHTLDGFGDDDGSWYVQHVTHVIMPDRLSQEAVLVRL